MEIWKPIKNFERYEVSNYGNVRSRVIKKRSRDRNKMPEITYRILKPHFQRGYYTVCISNDFFVLKKLVHRLVAEAFIPNPNNYPVINHKDENGLNNHVDNLEWCDDAYNANYGTRNLRIQNFHKMNDMNKKKVNQFDLNGNLIKTWDCLGDIERELGFTKGNISGCCNHRYGKKTSNGFKWEFA